MLRRSALESIGVGGSAAAAALARLHAAPARPRRYDPAASAPAPTLRQPGAAARRSLSHSATAESATSSAGVSSSSHERPPAAPPAGPRTSKASSAPTRPPRPAGTPGQAKDAPMYPSSRAHLSPARLPALFAHSRPSSRVTPHGPGEDITVDRLLRGETPPAAQWSGVWALDSSRDPEGTSLVSAEHDMHRSDALPPYAQDVFRAARDMRARVAQRLLSEAGRQSPDALSSSGAVSDASLPADAAPPPSVYYPLLRHAPLAATPLIFDDYCAFHEPDTHALNLLLRRHVMLQDCDAVRATSARLASRSLDGADEPHDLPSAALLSPSWSASWTPATWALMLMHATDLDTRAPEYLLALLGAVPASWLPQLLTPYLQHRVIRALAAMREARLAVELAAWMQGRAADKGTIAQRGQLWELVLRVGAEEQWYPAVKRGYEGATVSGRLPSPLDSGCLLSVLVTLSRAGDADLVEKVLQQSHAGQSPTWPQLEALFVAHCNAGSFESALRVLGRLEDAHELDGNGTSHGQVLAHLVKAAGKSELLWKKAHAAWMRVGTDPGPDGGVTTAGMNALIYAARNLGLHSYAHALYAKRAKLRARGRGASAGVSSPDSGAPATAQDAQLAVQPNKHTFHALLETYLDAGDSDGGRALLAAMAEQRPVFVGTTRTYELAVRLLCLTDRYADAFGYIAEAERRGTHITRPTLVVLRDACTLHNDPREAELEEQLAALFPDRPPRYTRGSPRTARE